MWDALKPKAPFGQMPFLEVDGIPYAQSSAIDRYAASLAGVYPTAPLEQLKVDQLVAFSGEFWEPFIPSMYMSDADEKLKVQVAAITNLKPKFEKLTSIIKAAGSGFLLGKDVSYADVQLYIVMSYMVSGAFVGVPSDYLNAYPEVKAHHNKVASLPKLAAYYATAEGARVAWKPLP